MAASRWLRRLTLTLALTLALTLTLTLTLTLALTLTLTPTPTPTLTLTRLFPASEVSSPAALLEAVRRHHGSLLLVELLHLCAIPWFALRRALADNDAGRMHSILSHAFHQMRAAEQPVHAQASALTLRQTLTLT